MGLSLRREDLGRLKDSEARVLEWFAKHGRRFPWRGEVGWYGVLVAEFMLVRTRSEVAERLFLEFMEKFPNPESVCSSQVDAVVSMFKRIGLPKRGERLVEAVCSVLRNYSGRVPCDYHELLKLPGVGGYIARVLLARVCGMDSAFVDSNVLRILSRFYGRPLRVAEAAALLESSFSGEELVKINVALIDIGSLVCKPRRPRCAECPLVGSCAFKRSPA